MKVNQGLINNLWTSIETSKKQLMSRMEVLLRVQHIKLNMGTNYGFLYIH